jgi:NAD(P)-dependent dehydrogenase (short-subunit alcohol dehydrogenase family)
MSIPVAVVTGAGSGTGLALTTHLLAKNYRVVMADIQNKHLGEELGENVLFVETDVSSWDAQAALFKQA